ncbi:MAG: tol-pal system YbgF family protein [Candidatus Methylomirabilales bacterium]
MAKKRRASHVVYPLTPPRDFTTRLSELRLPVGIAVLTALLAVSGWWGYRTWQVKRETAAQALLARALLGVGDLAQPPGTEEKRGAQQPSIDAKTRMALLLRIRNEYPSSDAAEEALLAIGNVSYDGGDYQQALQAYQDYLRDYPTGWGVFLAGLGKAYALESQQRYEQAAATFRTLADRYKTEALRVEALVGLARSLKAVDRGMEAIEVYQRIMQAYPGTNWARAAQEQLASLERGG